MMRKAPCEAFTHEQTGHCGEVPHMKRTHIRATMKTQACTHKYAHAAHTHLIPQRPHAHTIQRQPPMLKPKSIGQSWKKSAGLPSSVTSFLVTSSITRTDYTYVSMLPSADCHAPKGRKRVVLSSDSDVCVPAVQCLIRQEMGSMRQSGDALLMKGSPTCQPLGGIPHYSPIM